MKIKRDKLALYISILSLILFLAITFFVATNAFVINFDSYLNLNIRNVATSFLDRVAELITNIGDTVTIVILAVLFAVFLAYRKKLYQSGFVLSSVAGGAVLVYIFKILIQRDRPANMVISESGYGFPSGHAVSSLIFFSLLIYLYKDKIKNIVLKNLFVCANVLLILLMGLTRIYLRVHWFSDVIGGYLLGLFWIGMMFWAFGKSKLIIK